MLLTRAPKHRRDAALPDTFGEDCSPKPSSQPSGSEDDKWNWYLFLNCDFSQTSEINTGMESFVFLFNQKETPNGEEEGRTIPGARESEI